MKLEEVVASLKNLPPAPRVMPMLLSSLNDLNTSGDEIVQLLELDAGLAAKILTVSNSAYYGGRGDIAEVGEAVARLGFREIYRIVTNIYAKAFVGRSMSTYQIEADERWFNSVATGVVMELLTKRLQDGDPATAYTIGLLHDIGKSAVDEVCHETYQQVLLAVEEDHMTLQKAEQKILGFDHAQLGAALMRSWKFPDAIIEPIEFQFDPCHAKDFPKLASMLHLSRWICASIAGAPGTFAWAFELDSSVFETLQCSEEIVMQLILESKEELEQKEELLKF